MTAFRNTSQHGAFLPPLSPISSGAVSEMRNLLTMVLHELAPDEAVMAESAFRFEAGQNRPTRRQRAKFAAKAALGSSELAKSTGSEVALFETHCDQIAAVVTTGYSAASDLTHTVATRRLTHMALRQGDGILLRILPAISNQPLPARHALHAVGRNLRGSRLCGHFMPHRYDRAS